MDEFKEFSAEEFLFTDPTEDEEEEVGDDAEEGDEDEEVLGEDEEEV